MNNQNNSRNSNGTLTPKQKQAAIVCIVCALVFIATICITAVNVIAAINKANAEPEDTTPSTYTGENYIIDADVNSAVLTETEDAGDEYIEETLFIGDSNTVRFYNNGLLSLQEFCAQEGLGIQSALTEAFVTFEDDSTLYSIAEAVAMMKPRRVVITLGTNDADGSMSTESFIAAYTALLEAIEESYPYTDIIINSIPPVPSDHSNYPDMDQEVIDEFNMALADLALELGYKFLNSAEALKDSTGYGVTDYYVSSDIHLKKDGLDAILDYFTTHAYITEDRRPDTDNVAVRAQAFTSNTTTATPSPTTAVTTYETNYFVDSSGGGTLTSGSDTGKSSFSFDVETGDSVTVTAVPDTGYAFLKWSDGLVTAERTDTSITNVTAMFTAVGISLTYPTNYTVGESYVMTASVSGDYVAATDVKWYVNDTHVSTGASYSFVVAYNTTYSIYATISYNGTTIASDTLSLASITGAVVPDLSGMTQTEAEAALTAVGLKLGSVTTEESSTATAGTVISQGTAAGTDVVDGASVSIVLATAPAATATPTPTATVSSYVGQSGTDAKAALEALGFTNVSIVDESSYNSSITAGVVVSQNLTGSYTLDTAIVLTVSIGAEPTT